MKQTSGDPKTNENAARKYSSAEYFRDVWVLAGQSNMQGCGWLEGVLAPDERVWSFSSAGLWEVGNEPLHRLWESCTPVHQELMRLWMPEADKQVSNEEYARRENETRTGGSGLGLSFGIAMAEALGRPVGLIPAAHGGTSLDQWSPSLKYLGGRSLYGAMLQRIQMAGGKLQGILWYQGESDATLMSLASSYAKRFDEWIAAVRADTGIPDLPVYVVQIGRVIEPPDRQGLWLGWDLVREALRTLPERTPHTAVTSAVDLTLVDLIHIDTNGLIRLGKRLAKLALAGRQLGPQVAGIERIKSPGGLVNAIRVRFRGVTGRWQVAANLRGFQVRLPEAEYHDPLYVVNAWVDPAGDGAEEYFRTDVIVLLNREMEADVKLGYGLDLNSTCDLVDEADMPLCAFLPQPVS
jgi:sialate O-acetylesterase